ncbi:UNVERIFIED_CONTAM: hypothetical protein GTU68_009477, partial [Idotea baltica]|nr:hypothetical protein [Idotea baltica]
GFDCVPWQTCIDGYIDASGGSGLDQRSQPQKPYNYETDKCGQDEHMCCAYPTDILDTIRGETGIDGDTGIVGGIDIIGNQCGHANYDCVPYFQCIDGEINTDGAGLIDIRIRPRGVCVNSEYPDVPAVCCLLPGAEPTPTPVETCPGYKECVPFSMCSVGGDVITDGTGVIDIRTGYTSCYLDSGIGGICCNPPQPFVDTCPGKSICSSGFDCLGQALDASNNFIDYIAAGRWTTCSYGTEEGVCCIPPPPKIIDNCPGDSVCLLPSECKGEALNDLDIFVSYINEGSWTHCSDYDQGVCCVNPVVKEILRPAKHCGVRNYDIASRITSQNEAKFGEFPWQSIIFYQNYTYNCGATLISNKHVLTAAHCIDGLLASDIRIRFGEWQVNSFDEPLPYMDRNVYAIYIHPKFNPRNVHNDIAVMELLEPIEFQYHINAACLPSHGQIFDAYTPCIATGWGKDSFQGSFQHILKKIDLASSRHLPELSQKD